MVLNEDANELFGKAFNFSEADLIANRSGKLSQAQKNRLLIGYFLSKMFLSGLMGIVITLFGGWLLMSNEDISIVVKAIVLCLGLLFIVMALAHFINILRDISDNKVTIKPARIRLFETLKARGGKRYYMGLDGHRGEVEDSYDLTTKQYKILHQKIPSRVTLYLTPRSNLIVAIEEA